MYQIIASNQFGRDYKKCFKKHLPITLLDAIIIDLSEHKVIAAKHKIHKLSGEYKNCWECHIQPDWLLIWQVDERNKTIQLVRTGTHSDLFK